MSSNGEMLNKMLLFATKAHNGQYDKGGRPYILHPLAVMYMLSSDDEELQCIALGHDVVEDCGVTYEDLRKEGFSERIIKGIEHLTKIPGESKAEYRAKVKANVDSVLVKMADLRHNSDITRIKDLTVKNVERTVEYQKFYTELKDHLNNRGLA